MLIVMFFISVKCDKNHNGPKHFFGGLQYKSLRAQKKLAFLEYDLAVCYWLPR